ncbi:MAG: TonB-dependent receptor [Tissierellales bacterium]
MSKKMKLKGAVLLSASVASMGAFAQLEEIIVTAQKRAESMQEVPIAIQSFSANALLESGVTDTRDLAVVTPGLSMAQSGTGSRPYMRGLGVQDTTAGQESSVVTYLDGVLFRSSVGAFLSFDNLERVEVLKGPQGTLFGRNTTGGVINIITKDPSHETSGSLGASYGNYETVEARFYGTTGITDKLAADLSVKWSDQGRGYSRNLVTGNRINKEEDNIFARTKWKYTGDTADVTFSALYNKYSNDMGNVRGIAPGFKDLDGNTTPGNKMDIRNTIDPWVDYENMAVSLRIDKSFDGFDFVSISAYQEDEVDFLVDNDMAAANVMDSAILFDNDAFTQEFQILSNDPDARVTWMGGFFFMDAGASSNILISGPALQYGPAGNLTYLNDQRLYGEIDTRSYALFGEMNVDLAEQHSLTLGLRFTRDKRKGSGGTQAFVYPDAPLPNFTGLPMPFAPAQGQRDSFSEPTWRLVYDFNVSDDVMLYASYNRGFRSGNYNAVSPADPAFDSEVVDAFEVGFKSELFDGVLRLNGSVYYYEVDDLQLQTFETFTSRTVNAANAEITGAEVDLIWLATDALTFTFGASYSDGEYKDFPNAPSNPPNPQGGNLPAEAVDASGNQIINMPKWQSTLGATYELPTDSGIYTTGLRVTYNDGFPWEPDGRLEQDSYTLVNLTLGWQSLSEVWGVQLIGRNLTNEKYSVHTASTATGDFYAPAAPRTYSIGVNYNF